MSTLPNPSLDITTYLLNEAALARGSFLSPGALLGSGWHCEGVSTEAESTTRDLDLAELVAANLPIVSACREFLKVSVEQPLFLTVGRL